MLSLSSFELLWVRRACCPQSLEFIGISTADASKAVTLDVSEFTWHIMLVLEPRRSFLCGVEKVVKKDSRAQLCHCCFVHDLKSKLQSSSLICVMEPVRSHAFPGSAEMWDWHCRC